MTFQDIKSFGVITLQSKMYRSKTTWNYDPSGISYCPPKMSTAFSEIMMVPSY